MTIASQRHGTFLIGSINSKQCHARALASLGSISSCYHNLECAISAQLLVRLQQAILQPCASHGCEVWAPAPAAAGPLQELRKMQQAVLPWACRLSRTVPADVIFQELQLVRWDDLATSPPILDSDGNGCSLQHTQPCLSRLLALGLSGVPTYLDSPGLCLP